MKFLYIGLNDVFARHELGFLSALSELGKVDVAILGSGASARRICIGSDNGTWTISLYEVPCRNLIHLGDYQHAVRNIINVNDYDLVIATPREPILVIRKIFGRPEKILLRLWSIRAAKLRDNLRFGAYGDIAIFVPSIIANMSYILSSTYSITIDHSTYSFALKSYPFLRSRITKLYPPYGFICKNPSNEDDYAHILEIADRGNYIFGFTSLNKRSPYLKFEAKPHATILYWLAKRTNIDVILAGSTYNDWRRVFPHIRPPKNLHIVGRGFKDDIIRHLYDKARLVIIPITNRNISNRLLEALFYGAAIVTSDIVQLIHPELKHGKHIFISSWNDIVEDTQKLLNDEKMLKVLKEGAKEAYNSLFSTSINIKFMERLMRCA